MSFDQKLNKMLICSHISIRMAPLSGICNAALNTIEFAIQYPFDTSCLIRACPKVIPSPGIIPQPIRVGLQFLPGLKPDLPTQKYCAATPVRFSQPPTARSTRHHAGCIILLRLFCCGAAEINPTSRIAAILW